MTLALYEISKSHAPSLFFKKTIPAFAHVKCSNGSAFVIFRMIATFTTKHPFSKKSHLNHVTLQSPPKATHRDLELVPGCSEFVDVGGAGVVNFPSGVVQVFNLVRHLGPYLRHDLREEMEGFEVSIMCFQIPLKF